MRLDDHNHYYEDKGGIELHHDIHDIEGRLYRDDVIKLPWSILKAAVRRKEASTKQKPPAPHFQTAKGIEHQVAIYFGIRQHIIVPNVSWGMFAYELDMVILHRSLYADEVEIKVTKSDLKRDQNKRHRHDSHYIRRLWFAIPEKLNVPACLDLIPAAAGILVVDKDGGVTAARRPTINKAAPKWTQKQALQLARLGVLRIWNLKWTILKHKLTEDK